MTDHLGLKKKTLELFGRAEGLAKSLKDEPMLVRLQEARERLDGGKLYVVVCGEYKRGKSSLINALLEEFDWLSASPPSSAGAESSLNNERLEEAGLCPVKVDITTSLVMTIQYGERPKFTLLLGELGKETRKEISREEIADYVTEKKNPGNIRQARLLVVELPNPRLREGLVVVDTPGVGGVNVRHTDITYSFIPKTDAVLFITDPTPLAGPEREFLKLVDRHCKHVLFVVTKMDGDAGRKAGPVIEENRVELGKILGRPADSVTIIPTSSRTKIDYLQSRDDQDLADSGFPNLEKELWRLLGANRGRALLASALVKLARCLEDLREPIAAELTAADQEDRAKGEALEREYKEAVQQLNQLQENQAAWRTQLHDGLTDIIRLARRDFTAGFREIQRTATEYLKADHYLKAPQQIPAMLETDIDALMVEVQEVMEEQATELYGRLEESTGLSLERAAVQSLTFEVVEANLGDTTTVRSSAWQKTMTVGREAMFNAGAGATMGGLLGGAIGGILGFLTGGILAIPGAKLGAWLGGGLGLVAGKVSGLASSIGRIRNADHAAMRQKIAPAITAFLEDNKQMALDSLTDAQCELQRAMRDELEGRLKEEKRKCEQVLQRIKEARSRPASENAERLPALKQSLKQLNAIHAEVVKLGTEATAEPPAKEVVPTPLPPTAKKGGSGDRGEWADA